MITAQKSLLHVRSRIEAACLRCGRNPRDITLVGAGKTVSAQRLHEFYELGLHDIGENYVQEAVRKMSEMAPMNETISSSTRFDDGASNVDALNVDEASVDALQLKWHFIGALQSNKAREVVGKFSLIHSVDRVRLAQALNREAETKGVRQAVLLQVNIGDESGKAGCEIGQLPDLWEKCREMSGLEVRGLMCLPPAHEEAENSRPDFRLLRELRDELNGLSRESSTRKGAPMSKITELSMGMTRDYEVAIEEGATIIRIGSGLFGERSLNRT